MAPWYEEAEFYHIYPIGLTGAREKMNRKKPYTAFHTGTVASAHRRSRLYRNLYRPLV